jgi:hypothetical protein
MRITSKKYILIDKIMRRDTLKSKAGTTLVEMLIAMICLGIISLATYELIVRTQTINATLNAWNLLTEWGQTAINTISVDLTSGRVLYQDDAVGQTYISQLESDTAYPMLSTRTLPLIDASGDFGRDTSISRTGNALLFAVEAPPFITTPLDVPRRVDVYRLVCYYLSPVNKPIGKMSSSLRLVRWESKEFADYQQVMSMSGATRTNFVINLYYERGIRYLWIGRNLPDNAFYAIDEYGDISGSPEAYFTIPKDSLTNVINSLGLGSASISWNSSDDFWPPDTVPKFANGNSVGNGFPHGLEVQIIGPSGARQVMVRLVLAYFINMDNSIYSNESFTIITLKEY